MKPQQAWWPKELGEPDSSGSQNDTRYAYFARAHCLVVDRDGKTRTYDTGSHRIGGFGQQQGGGDAMAFQSDQGTVTLDAFREVT